MPVALHFHCRFTSPFHTSEHNFSNVSTCAPFVPGSTLRGAVLRWLIDRECTEIEDLHRDNNACFHLEKCRAECPIRPLFGPKTRFTFGQFDDREEVAGTLTRVSLARDTRSAAEGGLWTAEVRYGTFQFRVRLPNDDAKLHCRVVEAVKGAGELGVGRNKSLGWGRFQVLRSDLHPVGPGPTPEKTMRWRFAAPYVVRCPESGDPLNSGTLQEDLHDAWSSHPSHSVLNSVAVHKAAFSYFRRWTYETNVREPDESGRRMNRLVAEAGTELELNFETAPTGEHLAALSWGLGEWRECGFGAIEVVAD